MTIGEPFDSALFAGLFDLIDGGRACSSSRCKRAQWGMGSFSFFLLVSVNFTLLFLLVGQALLVLSSFLLALLHGV